MGRQVENNSSWTFGIFAGTLCSQCAHYRDDAADSADDVRSAGDDTLALGDKPLAQLSVIQEQARAMPGDDALISFPSTWSIGSKFVGGRSNHPSMEFDRVYDFYDPSTQELSVKDAHCGVIQSRHRRISVAGGSKAVPYDSSSEGSPSPKGETSKEREYKKKVVTDWGVMVGKALWCRMSGQGDRNQRTKFGLLAAAHEDGPGIERRAPPADASPGSPHQGKRVVKMAERRANVVVRQIRAMVKRVGRETKDVFDADWKEDALNFLFSADYIDTLIILANGARSVLESQPMLAQVELPCKVFGDIHGQLRDLLLLFSAFGTPGDDPNLKFVFNGDFVDRGEHQLEVIGMLFALKVAMPDTVWLVRGNHEDRNMNRKYGFSDVCENRLGSFGHKAFSLTQKAFDQLPLACLLDNRILVVHGGIGDGKWNVKDVLSVNRPLRSDDIYAKENQWIFNILWSDPIEEDSVSRQNSAVFGVHSSPRASTALQFGWNVTRTFCALNGLSLVIRSHQCQVEGSGFDVMHDDMLVRIFSARDYGDHGNDAAILSIAAVPDESEQSSFIVRPQVLRSLTKSIFSNSSRA